VVGALIVVGVVGMSYGGPTSWQQAREGSRYRVGDVEHTLPALDFGRPAPCLLRPPALDKMREVLAYTHELLAAQGIVHWLTTGTLLGAYRHQGFTPWDDDIDLQVPLVHLDQLRALRVQIERDGYRLLPSAGGFKLASGNLWCYPYVDLVMVAPQNDRMDQCFPLDRAGNPTFSKAVQWPRECFPTTKVFPLGKIAFEGMQLPVPREGQILVEQMYGREAMSTVRHRRWSRWHNHLFMMTAFRLGLSGG